jgi:hypothetical protein
VPNLLASGANRVVLDEWEREKNMLKPLIGVSTLIFGFALAQSAMAQDTNLQASKVAGGLGTIADYLQSHPEMMLDFTNVSGEYCLNTWKAGGAHMSHFAVDPSKTQEDVIEFVKASSMTDAGVDVTGLPRMPAELGAMEPGKWYYLPAGEFEPHHGKKLGVPLLIRASNLE